MLPEPEGPLWEQVTHRTTYDHTHGRFLERLATREEIEGARRQELPLSRTALLLMGTPEETGLDSTTPGVQMTTVFYYQEPEVHSVGSELGRSRGTVGDSV